MCVPVLPSHDGVNTVLEVFLASVCTPTDLRAQSRMMATAIHRLRSDRARGARMFSAAGAALALADITCMAEHLRYVQGSCTAHRPNAKQETAHVLRLDALRTPPRQWLSVHALEHRYCPAIVKGVASVSVSSYNVFLSSCIALVPRVQDCLLTTTPDLRTFYPPL